MNKIFFVFLSVLLSLIIIIQKTQTNSDKKVTLKETSVILAFGDSLTYGFGVDPKYSYPEQMQRKTGLKIINAGINGEISSEGLKRLPKLLSHYQPDLVILCHGGNDILRHLSQENLKANLIAMIKLIQKSGSEVLLVGVPKFSLLSFSTHPIYLEVVDETEVLFEDEVLSEIEQTNYLKSDYIHPNAKGYEKMADAFIKFLKLN